MQREAPSAQGYYQTSVAASAPQPTIKMKKGAKELTPEDVMEAEYLALEDQFMLQMGLRDPPEED